MEYYNEASKMSDLNIIILNLYIGQYVMPA